MNRFFRLMPAAVVLIVAFSSAFWAGCGKDNGVPPEPRKSTIDITAIIVNPLSPAPGQTALITAQVEGTGDAGTYEWTASGGTINDNGKISVSWTVPDTSKVYRISVRGTAGTATSTDTTYVLVRNYEALDTGLKYAFFPNLVEGELYYTGTNAMGPSLLGYHAYHFELPPTAIDKLTAPNISGGYEFEFFVDGVLTSSITEGAEYIKQQAMNVYFFPLVAGPKRAISNNEVAGTIFRKNQNLYPWTSSDLGMYVWQYSKVGPSGDGTQDLINIRFRAGVAPIQALTSAKDSVFQYGAWSYKFFRNIKPMFTPGDGSIVYFVDSTETYEPCIIPMDGIEPRTDQRRAMMVDPRRGIFFYAGIEVSERTIFQWNPVVPSQVLFIDDNAKLCRFDYLAETAEVIATGIKEFAWSDDGKLVGVNEDGVYMLEPGQTQAKLIFAKERSSDDVIGVNWSPGTVNQRIGFRLVRKGSAPVESFSVLVIYYLTDDRWYYASGQLRTPMSTEPSVRYTWMRAVFDPLADIMYVPVPLAGGGGQVVIYRSY